MSLIRSELKLPELVRKLGESRGTAMIAVEINGDNGAFSARISHNSQLADAALAILRRCHAGAADEAGHDCPTCNARRLAVEHALAALEAVSNCRGDVH